MQSQADVVINLAWTRHVQMASSTDEWSARTTKNWSGYVHDDPCFQASAAGTPVQLAA